MSVAAFVDGVDRLLTRAHGLFPAATADDGMAFSAGGGPVAAVPAGGSGLATGAAAAGDVYQRAQTTVAGLDAEAQEAATEADTIGAEGFSASRVIRDQARAQAAAIAPMTGSAAGVQLMVSTLDAQVAAMQRQLSTTTAQNQAASTRLRAVAQGYRGQGGTSEPQTGGQVRAMDFTQDGPSPAPGPQPFLPAYEQALTAPPVPPVPPPSGPAPSFLSPQRPPPPAVPPAPEFSPACGAAIGRQRQDLVKKIIADMGKGAALGGMAGVTVDGIGALPGLISGAAIGGIGGAIDWATSPNPLPQQCK